MRSIGNVWGGTLKSIPVSSGSPPRRMSPYSR